MAVFLSTTLAILLCEEIFPAHARSQDPDACPADLLTIRTWCDANIGQLICTFLSDVQKAEVYAAVVCGIGTCKSSDPLFFHHSVSVSQFGSSNQTITAQFSPDTGCGISNVANAYGYHHFNWINLVVKAPADMVLLCGGGSGLPILDPVPGTQLFCPSGWADNLDYYWNEINEDGSILNTELDRFTGSNALTFRDTPSWATLNSGNKIRFVTSLVGVKEGNRYAVLDSFSWETDFNGTAGGVTTFRNASDPDDGTGTGGVQILAEGIETIDLPIAVRQALALMGVEDVPLPEAIDGDLDGVTDDFDNCLGNPNSSQDDVDNDYVGDACDNCPNLFNIDQLDVNGDSIGDDCQEG